MSLFCLLIVFLLFKIVEILGSMDWYFSSHLEIITFWNTSALISLCFPPESSSIHRLDWLVFFPHGTEALLFFSALFSLCALIWLLSNILSILQHIFVILKSLSPNSISIIGTFSTDCFVSSLLYVINFLLHAKARDFTVSIQECWICPGRQLLCWVSLITAECWPLGS